MKGLTVCPRSELGKELLDLYEIFSQLGLSKESVTFILLKKIHADYNFILEEISLLPERKLSPKTTGESNEDRH